MQIPHFKGCESRPNNATEAVNYFSEVPIWKVHLFDDEIVGEKGLHRLANVLYAGVNPIDFFCGEKPY